MNGHCCAGMDYAVKHKLIDVRIGLPAGDRNPSRLQVIGYSIGGHKKGETALLLNVCPSCGKPLEKPQSESEKVAQ